MTTERAEELVERVLPEAPWVTDMRRHFDEHGFYRPQDLHRLLGKPWQSVRIVDGRATLSGHCEVHHQQEPCSTCAAFERPLGSS